MSTKEKVMAELLNADDYISGEALAHMLGVGRNSIWKAVKQLQEEGVDIQAVNNKGYFLKSTGDILNREIIKNFLNKTDDRDIIVLDETDSTNNYAKELARKGAKNATAVIAERQTAGKGRMGRSFCSPYGTSIYLSIILRPETDMETSQLITSCAAVAAAQAIDKVCGTDVKIKWVNDLFLNGKKICGILTEASVNFESGQPEYAVVGIGINVKSIKNIFSQELMNVATSIEDEIGRAPSRAKIIAEILKNMDKLTKNLSDTAFMEDYRKRSFIIGHKVSVSKFDSEKTALAIGISDNAGLIVRYEDGTEEILNSGEARILPSAFQ